MDGPFLSVAMAPAVSVVIAAYNKADTLADAIDSVLAQTYRDFEILVIDDGSTDDTAQRVQRYGDKIRYLPKKNGGTGSARNLGIAHARGRFVAFLDGDDLWLPNKLGFQMAAFDREPGLAAAQCSAYCVDPSLRVMEKRLCTPAQDTLLDFLMFRNLPAFASCVVVRKDLFERVGGFATDLVILSDWDMSCRLARAGILRSVPEPLVLYRQYPNNQSRSVEIHLWSGVRSLRRFFSNPDLAPEIRHREKQIWARFYAMLAGGYFRNGDWAKATQWAFRALRTSPTAAPYVIGMPARKIGRWLISDRRLSFSHMALDRGVSE